VLDDRAPRQLYPVIETDRGIPPVPYDGHVRYAVDVFERVTVPEFDLAHVLRIFRNEPCHWVPLHSVDGGKRQ
jgi:hypothetical protein